MSTFWIVEHLNIPVVHLGMDIQYFENIDQKYHYIFDQYQLYLQLLEKNYCINVPKCTTCPIKYYLSNFYGWGLYKAVMSALAYQRNRSIVAWAVMTSFATTWAKVLQR